MHKILTLYSRSNTKVDTQLFFSICDSIYTAGLHTYLGLRL